MVSVDNRTDSKMRFIIFFLLFYPFTFFTFFKSGTKIRNKLEITFVITKFFMFYFAFRPLIRTSEAMP